MRKFVVWMLLFLLIMGAVLLLLFRVWQMLEEPAEPVVEKPAHTVVLFQDTSYLSSIDNKDFSNVCCPHQITVKKGVRKATCSRVGYSGDEHCGKCNSLVRTGKTLALIPHKIDTVNIKEATVDEYGYTGDVACVVCPHIVSPGIVVPKVNTTQEGRFKWEFSDGDVICSNSMYEISKYSMQKYGTSVSRPYATVENKILELCNEARATMEVHPLIWYDASYKSGI